MEERAGPQPASAAEAPPASVPLGPAPSRDLNQASEDEIARVKGVGPVAAANIVRERDRKSFATWADLQKRADGLGPGKVRHLFVFLLCQQSSSRVQAQNEPTNLS